MAIYTHSPFPRHYGSSSGHRQAVGSSAPLMPVKRCEKTKEIRKFTEGERKKERKHQKTPPYSAPNLSSSSPLSQARSSCSLASHSEASLAASSSSSATGGPDVRPTSVVARNWSTAWLHSSSASSFAILVLSRPRAGPGSFRVSSRTVAQRVFC